jgi:hypothetical protein
MKSTVPLDAQEPGNVEPAFARSKRRFVRIAGVSVAVLVVAGIIGSFYLLFPNHHPGSGKAPSVTSTAQPDQSPPYSYSWTRVSNVLLDHGQLYVPQGDLLRVLSPNNGMQSSLYHFPRAEWTPVIDHGTIYMVTESGTYSYVEAWRASDSVLLWRYQMNCCARSLVPLVVTNGVVYVSDGSARVVPQSQAYRLRFSRYSLSAVSKQVILCMASLQACLMMPWSVMLNYAVRSTRL